MRVSSFLAGVVLVALVASTAAAWDRAPTPQKRLEILQGAARRKDAGEFAACFAPPFDQIAGDVWKGALRHDAALAALAEAISLKLDPQVVQGTPLELKLENFSPLHWMLTGGFSIGEVKPDPSSPDRVHVTATLKEDSDGCHDVVTTVLLVKVKDDWRLVFDDETWPEKSSVETMTRTALEIGRVLDKAGADVEKVTADLNAAIGEAVPSKDVLVERFTRATEPVKKAIAAHRAARAEATNAEKASKEKAAAAEREAQEKAAAADREAKAKADAEAKAKAEAAKKAAEAAKAPPPPPPAPVVAKPKPDEKPDEPFPEKKTDNTGTFIVLGLIGLVGVGVIGFVISNAKKDGRGGAGRGRGGPPPEKRGGTGRHKRRRK